MELISSNITESDIGNFFLFLVPGIIFTYIRFKLLTGTIKFNKESIFCYFCLTLIYHSLLFPISKSLNLLDYNNSKPDWYIWYSYLFLMPLFLGIVSAVIVKNNLLNKVINRINISVTHPIDSSWDWYFSQYRCSYVIITLKDKYKFHGYIGSKSFCSSSASERDIFIEQAYSCKEGEPWTYANSSVLILAGEIQSIEFIHPEKDNGNE